MSESEGPIGRAVLRLVELGAQDQVVRVGLAALAESITRLLEEEAPVAAEPAEPATAGEPVPAAEPEVEARPAEPAQAAPAQPAHEVPLDRAGLIALIDEATQRAATAHPPAYESQAAAAPGPEIDPLEEARERNARLEPIVTRARLRAAVARAAAARARDGSAVDDELVDRARSEGASLWMLDLREPDPAALETLAVTLDAVADAAELVSLLAQEVPEDPFRRAEAVRGLAATQSALRLASAALHASPDEDQLAAFWWLRDTTSLEHIYVKRHMRLEDPLDPADLPEVMDGLLGDLAELRDQAGRRRLVRKRLQQVRYHAGLIESGKGSGRDIEKVVEAVAEAVESGLPPTSLDLRDMLAPIFDRLPEPDGRPPAYARVHASLDEHRRRSAAPPEVPPTPDHSTDQTREAASLLRGRALVLVGGERRVESQRAIAEALGLSRVDWYTLSDDLSLEDLERIIARDDVAVVAQLIRWSRHRHGDAAKLAAAYGKPFVRVTGGYNPAALAKAILEQASERLRGA